MPGSDFNLWTRQRFAMADPLNASRVSSICCQSASFIVQWQSEQCRSRRALQIFEVVAVMGGAGAEGTSEGRRAYTSVTGTVLSATLHRYQLRSRLYVTKLEACKTNRALP